MTKTYDLIVIGTGSGNIVAEAALQAGKTVALIEKSNLGGTCLNQGCIPTKILLTPADIYRAAKHYQHIGLSFEDWRINWPTIRQRMREKVDQLRHDTKAFFNQQPNCTLYEGTAVFSQNQPGKITEPEALKHISINHSDGQITEIAAPTVVIAVGGQSRILKLDGLLESDYWTSETFFNQQLPKKLPDSITIIGGADIGVEFAHFFHACGCKVHLIQHNIRLVPKQDEAISEALYQAFKTQDIDVWLNQDTVCVNHQNGNVQLTFKDRKTGQLNQVESDKLFISAGIVSHAPQLHPENIGLTLTPKGWIETNEFLQTHVPGVYAVGDINGLAQLRHKANYEAEIVAYNLYQRKENEPVRYARYDAVPSATFTYPQIGRVGMTEAEAKQGGRPVLIAKQPFSNVIKSFALGIEAGDIDEGFVKLIIDASSKQILGAHLIGHEAAILAQGLAWLMQTGDLPSAVRHPEIEWAKTAHWRSVQNQVRHIAPNQIEALTQTMTIHPALSEVVGWAPQHMQTPETNP